ncbi:phosphomethylpyrimidine kinase [Campylobacter sp. BCW_6879]|nr:phosphomethylpyrimidine kinase [Campylobacter sp. BCW_6879]
MFFSKSKYIRGTQCAKSLWLQTYKKDVLSKPDENALAKFSTGDKVGELACKLFPNGVKIEFEGSSFDEKCEQTRQLLKNNQEVIYEATFCYNDILVMIDILQNTKEGLIINEIKSSTSLKNIYTDDCSLQYYVLSNLNYKIKQVNLIHLNNGYYKDDFLDINQLFISNDITDKIIQNQEQVKENLKYFEEILNKKEEPDMDIGTQCFDPYECDGYEYCWIKQRNLCENENIFNISRLNANKKFELYYKDIIDFKDIKDLSIFNENQQIQIKASLNKEIYINKENIKKFLNTLTYPIYHLDFETFMQAVPEFKGVKPYMQIPFQYSLHIDYKDKLEHKEFLSECRIDPRYELAKNLINDIPKDACVLAYNASFEKGVIRNLALIFPEFSEHLLNIEKNIKDLMLPFQNKDYYHYKMQGSYSIKKILPALIPDMEKAYKDLELIHNGNEAMQSFELMQNMDQNTQVKYRKALLEYCKLDTLAMVKILKHLEEITKF